MVRAQGFPDGQRAIYRGYCAPTMTIRIFVADDHSLVRLGIASLLGVVEGFAVCGETDTGTEIIERVQAVQPDVLLLDLVMPGTSGFEVLEQLAAQENMPRVIVLSMHGSREHVLRAFELGAVGYVLKDLAPQDLVPAIRAVMQGERWISEILEVGVPLPRKSDIVAAPGKLSDRQREVLVLIARGYSTREISEQLGLSIKTIETHRAQIMERLDIYDIPGLVRYAILHGLIPL